MFGKLTGRGPQPKASAKTSLEHRIGWKIETLRRLDELGIWLRDASVHAIALGAKLRRSQDCCCALHRQWWKEYGSAIVSECVNPLIWVIGKGVYQHLDGINGFHSRGFVYQPNARDVDKEFNWPRLLKDVQEISKS